MTVRRFPLIAALALLTTPALAAPDTTAPASTATTPAMQGSAVPVHTPHDPSPDQLETHITTLHQQLGITPAQESAWSAFAQVMRDNAARFHDSIEQRRSKLATLNAPDNMQSYADLITQRAQDLQSLNMAFRTLYNGLSDTQKKAADILFRQSDSRPKQAVAH